MSKNLRAFAQTGGLLVGIGFIGFAVAAIDLSASTTATTTKTDQATAAQPAAVGAGWAARTVTPLDPTLDHAAVQEKVEAFRAAMVAADVETLSQLADEHLSFGHSNGTIQTKADFLKMITSGSEVFNSIELTDPSLIMDGDVAMERHTFNSDIVINGKLVSVSLGILEIWHKRGTEWVLVARQAFKT